MLVEKRNKGFTLIELLAVIFIISLLFGVSFYYVNNVINESKDRSSSLSKSSIQRSASLYVQEYSDKVVWIDKKTCVSIDDLVKAGYIKENQKQKIDDLSVNLIKNDNGTIDVDSSIAGNQTCDGKIGVPVPTSKEYCSTPSYNNGNILTIARIPQSAEGKVSFADNSYKQVNAGSYEVNVKLNTDDYVWSDGTNDNKKITCSIKKAVPELTIITSSNPSEAKVGSVITPTIKSNVRGTLSVKSSNSSYVVGTFKEGTMITANGEKTLSVNILASRNGITTYLYVTLTPDDTNNYYTGSVVYTIGDTKLTKVNRPDDSWCSGETYKSGGTVNLIKSEYLNGGYTFSRTKTETVGSFDIDVSLKYGYVWDDDSFATKRITCSIKAIPEFKIVAVKNNSGDSNVFQGDMSSGTLMKTHSITLTLESNVVGSISARALSGTNVSISGVSSDATGMTHYVTLTGESETNLIKVQITFSGDPDKYYPKTVDYPLKIISNTYKVDYYYNLFVATSKTQNGVTITYDQANQYLILNGTDTSNSLLFGKLFDTSVAVGDKYRVTLNRISGSYTTNKSSYKPKFVFDFQKDGSQYNPRTSDTHFRTAILPTSNASSFTLTVSSAVTDSNNFYYWLWHDKSATITYKNYKVQVLISKVDSKDVTYGSTYGNLSTPTKKGYTFNGWYTSVNGGTKVESSSIYTIANNQTLYAHWTANNYTITFDNNYLSEDIFGSKPLKLKNFSVVTTSTSNRTWTEDLSVKVA